MMLTAMLNSFPQSQGDISLRLDTLEAALKGVTDNAIIEACGKYIRAEVKDHNPDFAPSVPRFVTTAREMEALVQHKKWLEQNRASLQPRETHIPKKAVPDGVWRTIDTYRANYQERLKTEPNLTYPDSIRRDFKTATGQTLNIPNPARAS
jgi:hypothetical protein